MRLAVGREPISDPDWIWELKYDGFRVLLQAAVFI
jgi:ATP-dependent DNA ligase